MESTLKKPKKGAGERLRDFYNKNLRKQPMSDELKDALKKKEQPVGDSRKRIANSDVELP